MMKAFTLLALPDRALTRGLAGPLAIKVVGLLLVNAL
jgi:hypothetical protein